MEGADIEDKSSCMRKDYTVRKLRSDELPVVCSWAYKEDWLISEDAVQCAYETDSEGAFVAVSSSGELIGCIQALNYSTVCTVSLFIVLPQWRKKGIGQALLEQAVVYSDNRNILLSSVDTSINYYVARNISMVDMPVITYVGEIDKKSRSVGKIDDNIKILRSQRSNSTNILLKLVSYDEAVVGMSRERYLQKWMDKNLTYTYVALNKEEIVGYCCIQKVGSGAKIHQIGPLYANEASIAKMLLAEVINNHVQPDEEITMDIAENVPFNIGKEYNLTPALPMHRIYSKEPMSIDYSRIYCFTNTGSAWA